MNRVAVALILAASALPAADAIAAETHAVTVTSIELTMILGGID